MRFTSVIKPERISSTFGNERLQKSQCIVRSNRPGQIRAFHSALKNKITWKVRLPFHNLTNKSLLNIYLKCFSSPSIEIAALKTAFFS